MKYKLLGIAMVAVILIAAILAAPLEYAQGPEVRVH